MYGANTEVPDVCGLPFDVNSRTIKVCVGCGLEQGVGHNGRDCGGYPGRSYREVNSNGHVEIKPLRSQAAYEDVNVLGGPWCKNGHLRDVEHGTPRLTELL